MGMTSVVLVENQDAQNEIELDEKRSGTMSQSFKLVWRGTICIPAVGSFLSRMSYCIYTHFGYKLRLFPHGRKRNL